MKSIQDTILSIDDKAAVAILTTFANAQLREVGCQTDLSKDLQQSLAVEFEISATAPSSTPGDLARQALLLAVEDPHHAEGIKALVEVVSLQKFAVVETVAIVSAALIVLQMHVKFERDKNGRFSFKIEKKPTSDKLLTPLVEKILKFTGVSGSA